MRVEERVVEEKRKEKRVSGWGRREKNFTASTDPSRGGEPHDRIMYWVDSSKKSSAGIGFHADFFRFMERGNLRCKFHRLYPGCIYEKVGKSRWESVGILGDRRVQVLLPC